MYLQTELALHFMARLNRYSGIWLQRRV